MSGTDDLARAVADVPRRAPVPWPQQARAYLAALRPGATARPRFVILAQGRSGSELLTRLLDQHPAIACEGELLYHPVTWPDGWVRAHRARHRDRAFGFKVKPYQLSVQQGVANLPAWVARMHRAGWVLVHLRRENVARQVLSSAVAWRRSAFHARAGERVEVEAFAIDPGQFRAHVLGRAALQADEAAAVAPWPHVAFVYERDLATAAGHQATVDRVAGALGLSAAPVAADLSPTRVSDLGDVVLNLPELRRAIADTPWADDLGG